MRISTLSNIALAVLLVSLYPLHQAHAYLDPGTGSYIIQIGAAAIFTALYSIKLFWKNIVTKVKGMKKEKQP